MKQMVEDEINRLINILIKEQNSDGSWSYLFETGMSTNCYIIILLRTLEIDDEDSRNLSSSIFIIRKNTYVFLYVFSIEYYRAFMLNLNKMMSGQVSTKNKRRIKKEIV
jgi:hypothetical protein